MAEKQVSRRDFLKMIGVVTGAAVASKVVPVGRARAAPAAELPQGQIAKAAKPDAPTELVFREGKLRLNNQDLPVNLTLNDGRMFPVDPIYSKEVIEKAMAEQVPQVIKAFPFTEVTTDSDDRGEGYYYSTEGISDIEARDLPKGFIYGQKELKEKGVRVIPPIMAMNERAFQEGGPLECLSKTGSTLTIVLTDTSFVPPEPEKLAEIFPEQRYEAFRESIAEEYDKQIATQIFFGKIMPSFSRQSQQTANLKRMRRAGRRLPELAKKEQEIVASQMEGAVFSWLQSNLEEARKIVKPPYLGEFCPLGSDGPLSKEFVVFIAAGKEPDVTTKSVGVYTDSEGKLGVRSLTLLHKARYDRRPKGSDSYPSSDQLRINPDIPPEDRESHRLEVGAIPFGPLLAHELGHLVTDKAFRINYYGEAFADISALNYVEKASGQFQACGSRGLVSCKPEDQYLFAVKLPRGERGNFMISQKPQVSDEPKKSEVA